jgi:hypothetical protein
VKLSALCGGKTLGIRSDSLYPQQFWWCYQKRQDSQDFEDEQDRAMVVTHHPNPKHPVHPKNPVSPVCFLVLVITGDGAHDAEEHFGVFRRAVEHPPDLLVG